MSPKLDIVLSTHALVRGIERLRQEFEESGEPLEYTFLIQKVKEAIEYGRIVQTEGSVETYRLEDFDYLLSRKANKYVVITIINKRLDG